MAWEAAFGLEIPNDAATRIATTTDAVDWIYSQLPHANTPSCITRQAFFVARGALVQELGLSRRTLGPTTRLSALLPRKNRRALWSRVGAATGLPDWPPLTDQPAVVA